MESQLRRSLAAIVLVALFAPSIAVAQRPSSRLYKAPDDINYRQTTITSEGTRMVGELFSLKSLAGQKLPTIVMSHGWGGVAALLRRDAVAFARAGYLVLTFDYRGWGASDSRVILTQPAPEDKSDGRFMAEVKEVREVIDPLDQTTDILNAIHFVVGEPQCDAEWIGLWGSSYSGGHVVYCAARDPRVKATISQVPALDSRFVTSATEEDRRQTFDEATRRARGELGYPEPGARAIGNLRGAPIREKLMRFAPVEDADKAPGCAMLFILAENEELFDNREHGILAHERAKGPKKLVIVEGITHYGIYTTERDRAIKLATEWYDEHLKK